MRRFLALRKSIKRTAKIAKGLSPKAIFLVVIEKAKGNYSAYSPDLPGCVATGKTKAEAEENIYEAIKMHI